MLRNASAGLMAWLAVSSLVWSQDNLFSGPQVGEKLSPFNMRLALEAREGQDFDAIADAGGEPVLIIFVHNVTRPSVALTRTVANYAHRFRDDGLHSSIVFLTADPTEAQAMVRRARHALPTNVPIGISPDGIEGPGVYGLNRKMTLTILLGKEDRVTANFALVQPGLAADAPRIGAAIQSLLGKNHQPDLAEMGITEDRTMQATDDAAFRRMLSPVINRNASPEQVAEAAQAVETYARENPAFRQRLGETAQRIINAGVLDNYGTPPAREYLRNWAKEFVVDKPDRP